MSFVASPSSTALPALRGKFVLLDFWTYCCINCMHILPELKKLEHAYPNELVVIGVHSAKFDAEKETENIRQAMLRYEIEHPVVNDADYKIWNAYNCTSWPSLRAIDPEGNLVAESGGEIDFASLDAFMKKDLPTIARRARSTNSRFTSDLRNPKPRKRRCATREKSWLMNPSDRLFIADSNHNRIVVAGLDGNARGRSAPATSARADGDFATATFNHPQGMALHGDTLYVADTENHLLRKVDLKNRRVATIAGTGHEAHGPQESSGPPLKTELNSPWALCIHGNDLYIAMAGPHQIWKMPLDESAIGPYAGNGREDIVDGQLLPPQPFQTGFASFAQPSGLSSDDKFLYVADSEGSSVRAVPFDPSQPVRTLIGTADLNDARLFTFGDVDGMGGKARLQHCLDVAQHDGCLYVADTYNNKIKAIDLKTGECKSLAGTGKQGSDDSASAKPAAFFEPAGLTYAAGKLFVADTNNHRIRVIDLCRRWLYRIPRNNSRNLRPHAARNTSLTRESHGKRHAVQFNAGIENAAPARIAPGHRPIPRLILKRTTRQHSRIATVDVFRALQTCLRFPDRQIGVELQRKVVDVGRAVHICAAIEYSTRFAPQLRASKATKHFPRTITKVPAQFDRSGNASGAGSIVENKSKRIGRRSCSEACGSYQTLQRPVPAAETARQTPATRVPAFGHFRIDVVHRQALGAIEHRVGLHIGDVESMPLIIELPIAHLSAPAIAILHPQPNAGRGRPTGVDRSQRGIRFRITAGMKPRIQIRRLNAPGPVPTRATITRLFAAATVAAAIPIARMVAIGAMFRTIARRAPRTNHRRVSGIANLGFPNRDQFNRVFLGRRKFTQS